MNKLSGSLNMVRDKNIRSNLSSSMFQLLIILFTVKLHVQYDVSQFFQNLVAEYIRANNLNIPQFRDGIPGQYWLKNFMKRNKLSHKKAEMISSARLSNTSNAFIIYDFYDQVEKVCIYIYIYKRIIHLVRIQNFLSPIYTHVHVRIKGQEMLLFRKVLRRY